MLEEIEVVNFFGKIFKFDFLPPAPRHGTAYCICFSHKHKEPLHFKRLIKKGESIKCECGDKVSPYLFIPSGL